MNWEFHKVHFITELDAKLYPAQIKTVCGMVGYKTRMSTEFDTVEGNRFEAVAAYRGITCVRCRRFATGLPTLP